jgi:hypothetical protein
MKKMSFILIILMAFGFTLLFIFHTSALAQKVTFSADGKKMIFPDKDGIPDADISGIKLELSNVPPEAQFMVGKIYRADIKHPLARRAVMVGYLFLVKWSDQTVDLHLSKSRTQLPAMSYIVTCTPKGSLDFSCTHKEKSVQDSLGPVKYHFTIKDKKPVLEANETVGDYEEVGVLPESLTRK